MITSFIGQKVRGLRRKWAEALGLPFQEVLPASVIAQAADAEGIEFRDRVFSPLGYLVGLPGPDP